jgi:hypothetical protein
VTLRTFTVLVASPPGGGYSHSDSVTIEGSGFGTGPTVVIYDDFSTGSLDALVRSTGAIVGAWETGTGDDSVTRSNAVSRGVHSRSAFHDFSVATGSYAAALCLNETFTDYWYFDWWHRVSPVPANVNPSWTRNYKTFRFYEPQDPNGGNNFALTHHPITNPVDVQFYTRNTTPYVGGTTALTSGQWQHFKLRFYIPQTFANNDVLHFSRTRNGLATQTIYSGTWRGALGTTQYPHQFRLGDYWARDADANIAANAGGAVYTSCVHIQRGWARVELGNAATYAACTITEIQRPTAWGPSSIQYVVNKGLLSSGAVYEYVFDSTNTQVQVTQRTLA